MNERSPSAKHNLRDLLRTDADYTEFNREERHYCALLFHLLLKPGGIESFLELCGLDASGVDIASAEVFFEYAHLRDRWHRFARAGSGSMTRAERAQRLMDPILQTVRPPPTLESTLRGAAMAPEDRILAFNQYFGASPRASRKEIQMPARWRPEGEAEGERHFDRWCDEGGVDFAERACMLKWAFNAKADLVIHLSDRSAVCVEAKLESGESTYKVVSNHAEHRDGGGRFSKTQTEIQRHLMRELLGYEDTRFVMVSASKLAADQDITRLEWANVFGRLREATGGDEQELPCVRAGLDAEPIRNR